jgi:hypothetical protein
MKKLQSTDSRVIEAIKLYDSGRAIKPICKLLKMDDRTLRTFLLKENVLRTRSKAIQQSKLQGSINHNIFDDLTPEALYWIGFLYADGHIEKDRPRISVTLSSIDHEHLVKLSKFFGDNITIRVLGTGHHRVAFSSISIYEKLITMGFSNRKTYAIIPHITLKTSRDFWRGVVDGDGWICNKKQTALGLCGHINTIQAFLKYVNDSGISTKAQAHKVKKRQNLWTVDLHANKDKAVAELLYKDSTVYLERKYQKYQEIINT